MNDRKIISCFESDVRNLIFVVKGILFSNIYLNIAYKKESS